MYMIPMELLSICYFNIHFQLPHLKLMKCMNKFEEIDPKIAISDQNTIRIKLSKENYEKYQT